MVDLRELSASQLLALHADLGEELRTRELVRSANNPTGDLAEFLFCQAFGWAQEQNSARGFDATDAKGIRYQIKGRRLHSRNKSRQLSALRKLEVGEFDVLAAVLFEHDYTVCRAGLIPLAVVQERASFSAHTNSSIFLLRDEVWEVPGVRDVTVALQQAMP